MLFNTLPMALVTLVLSLGICVYAYFRDRKEKEPIWLLASLFAVSAVLYVPVYYLGRRLINSLFDQVFVSETNPAFGVATWTSSSSEILHHALSALVGIALLEEIVRWLILYFFTQKSRHFNCTFDGVLYSVMVSMGAVFGSNLRYAFVDGWDQFLLRLLYSLPWYLLLGVIMGVFYTLWHTKRQANRTENKLIDEQKLKKDKLKYPIFTLILSWLVPIVLHTIYSYLFEQSRLHSPYINLIFYAIAAVLMVLCVGLMGVLAKRDQTKREAIEELIEKEHGDLPDEYYDVDLSEEKEADDQ